MVDLAKTDIFLHSCWIIGNFKRYANQIHLYIVESELCNHWYDDDPSQEYYDYPNPLKLGYPPSPKGIRLLFWGESHSQMNPMLPI